MFEAHGKLCRVVVPPAGTMAVVEFEHTDEAKKAFRALAYRRLGNSIVYLEKGPLGMFQEVPTDADASASASMSTAFKPVTIPEQESPHTVDEQPLSAGTTLFVKNLAFSTTSDRLRHVFGTLPGFSFARIQTKPDPKRPAVPGADVPRLSMGYGFVGFKTPEFAKSALKGMEGFVLDGHALHVKFAGRGKEDEEESKDKAVSKSRTTKMIVKNVPFEATRKDIRELFGCVPVCWRHDGQLTFNCLCTIHMLQSTWTTQVRPPSEAIRRTNARVRVPRLPHETGGRERVCSAQAHAFAWAASRAGLGGGSGARFGCSPDEGWGRIRRRGRDAWEEAEVGFGRGTRGRDGGILGTHQGSAPM